MTRIRIKNFGPIIKGNQENDGWLDVKKVTVFIGNQGVGKSTVAKLIATFTWIEKALVRGDYDKTWFERKNKLKSQYLNYHRLENYFRSDGKDKTFIEYQGDAYTIRYADGQLQIDRAPKKAYPLPQIMYVPAERNFIAYVKTPKELKLSSPSLKEFLTEFDNAKNDLKGSLKLPVNNAEVEYDKLNDTLNLRGESYKVRLTEASSGFQSLVPVYMVTNYLAKSIKKQSESGREGMSIRETQRFKEEVAAILTNYSLTIEQKRIALSVLSSKFNKNAFINIVEEPEQNLFPESQQKLLYSLLEFNNMNEGNKLVLTTHSPYLINYLTLAVKANALKNEAKSESKLERINKIVPLKLTIKAEDLVIYELDGEDGSIRRLGSYNGLPSDENELNEKLGESNELFAQLLEIQQSL
jgi:predicted ATPase